MKFVILFILLSLVSLAQELPTKGNMTIGGNLLFASTNYPNSSITIFSFTPQFSYFLSEKTELGGSLSIQTEKYSSIRHTTVGVGPFLSAYLTSAEIKPFIGIAYTYYNESASYGGQSSSDNSQSSFSLFGGLLFPLNQRVAIQPILQYSVYFGKDIQLGDVTQIMLGIGIKAFL